MPFTELFLAYIFGTIIGSFLNVVIFRYNSGFSILGRSQCLSCGTKLSWKELVPVASFLIQRGRCATCSARISKQYVSVELAAGILFAAVAWKHIESADFLPILFAADLAIWCLLIVIFVYDSKHTVIPDGFVWAFNVIALARIVFSSFVLAAPGSMLVPLVAGPAIAIPFLCIWIVSRGAWIGLGDAKLALGIGWMLGLASGISAVLIGVWAGALWSLGVIGLQRIAYIRVRGIFGKKLTAKTEIPFAPFLIIGIAAVYFLEWNVIAF